MKQQSPQKTDEVTIAEKQRKRLLWTLFLFAVGLHVAAGLLFGSLVVFQHFFKKETTFEAPPEVVKTIDPRKIEHKVKVRETQQASGRPQVQQRLAANRISEISLPALDLEVTPVKDALQERLLQNFNTSGLGTGLGTGVGTGGLSAGTSKVNFFGIQAQGERMAFLVDISRSMVEDDKGGIPGYDVLKREVKSLIEKLSEGTFFNVILFDQNVDILFPDGLKLANKESKQKAIELIDRYYRLEDFGTHEKILGSDGLSFRDASQLRNFTPPEMESVRTTVHSGTTRLDLALLAAFSQRADSIFIIADGRPELFKQLTEKEQEELDKRKERLAADLERRREAFFRDLERENARRARRGLPPKMIEIPSIGIGPPLLSDTEVLEYIRELAREFYGDKRSDYPRIYAVGYAANDDALKFLQTLARDYRGRFRKIRGLARPIQ